MKKVIPSKSVINNDKAWRTLLRFSFGAFKLRFYVEPRDVWIGAFWDMRGFDFIAWVCLIPCFPLQLVLTLPGPREYLCPCGFKHGDDQPEWCKRLLRAEATVEALREYIEQPLIQRRMLDEYFKWRPENERKK